MNSEHTLIDSLIVCWAVMDSKRCKYETIDFTEGTDAKADLTLEVDGFKCAVNKAILEGIL